MRLKIILISSTATLALMMGDMRFAFAQGPIGEEIIVYARKRTELMQDVPLAITTLSGDQLRQQSVQEISDIQNQTPGLYFEDGGTDQSAVLITMRGQGQVDNFLGSGPSVGVYVDGIYNPRQIGLKSSMIDIERVEVLKGPQGTLYGRNTTGGALNIFTKQPNLENFGGYMSGTFGDYGRSAVEGAIGIPIVRGKVGLRVAGVISQHEGFGRDGLGLDRKDEDSKFIRFNALIRPSENFELALTGDWLNIAEAGALNKLSAVSPFGAANAGAAAALRTSFAGGFAALNSFVGGDPYVTGGTAISGSHFDSKNFGATATVGLGEIQWKTILAYRFFHRRSDHDYDASPFNILQGSTFTYDKFWSAESNFSGKALSDRLDWVIGGYYSDEKGDFDTSETQILATINPFNPAFIDSAQKNSGWAVYTQGTYAVTPRLHLTGGFRWSSETRDVTARNRTLDPLRFLGPSGVRCDIAPGLLDSPGVCAASASKTFSDYNYLASVDYKITDDVLIYVKTSRGFRSGGLNGASTDVSAGFRPFEPEIATDYELGLKTEWFNKRLRINGAGYYTDYSEIQRSVVVATLGGGLTTLTTNAAKASIKGGEIEVVATPVDNFTFVGTFTYTGATYDEFLDLGRDRSGEKFPVPKITYSLSGRYAVPLRVGQIALQADWIWRDTVVFEPTAVFIDSVTAQSYGLLNLRLSYAIDDLGLEVAAFMRNALDKTYRTTALNLEALGFNTASTGDPRVFGVQIRKTFGGG